MNQDRFKYQRTFHLPFSQCMSSDDKMLKDCSQFEGKEVVVTEKMDGENTTFYSDGYFHARSISSVNGSDRAWVKQFLSNTVIGAIPSGWRICGENVFAKHSIEYKDLESYFYGFSIWDENNSAISWDETLEWFSELNITPVKTLFRGIWDEAEVKNLTTSMDLTKAEGFVVRLVDSFKYEDFSTSVAKFVRANHVQTEQHWRHSKLIRNGLVNKTDVY